MFQKIASCCVPAQHSQRLFTQSFHPLHECCCCSRKQRFGEAVNILKGVDGLRASLKHVGKDGVNLKGRSSKRDCPALVDKPAENFDLDVTTEYLDVITLGNLCVDIVLSVSSLPPASLQERYDYMENLVKSAPDENFWEGGGNCNFAIAAARLGLRCATLGHVGDEKYGKFLHRVLEKEGVQLVGIGGKNVIGIEQGHSMFETLLCWVLVDSERQHGFCRFDYLHNLLPNRRFEANLQSVHRT